MSNISKQRITDTLQKAISEYADENNIPSLQKPNGQSRLYGPGGLDSMGLVILIGELEERIEEEFDVQITLADEKAMSQTVSPFRSINALAGYVHKLLTSDE